MDQSQAEIKAVRQKNGQIILEAIREIDGRKSFKKIVAHIAENQEMDAKEIKPMVKYILSKLVEFGAVNKSGLMYDNTVQSPEDRIRRRRAEPTKRRRRRSVRKPQSRSHSRRRRSRSRSRSE